MKSISSSKKARCATQPEEHSELPLIVFTLCAAASVGFVLVDLAVSAGELLAGTTHAASPANLPHLCLSGCSLLLVTAGMIASVAHLAKPLRSPRALSNLASSWLSREILIVAAYWACIALWMLAQLRSATLGSAASLICLAAGVFLLAAAAKAYAIAAQPAWNGPDTFVELMAAAFGAGIPTACFAALFAQGYVPVPLEAASLALYPVVSDAAPASASGVSALAAEEAVSAAPAVFPALLGRNPYLITEILILLPPVGALAARALYALANKTRGKRLASAKSPTPREEAAAARCVSLEGPGKLVAALIDASALSGAVGIAVWLICGHVSLWPAAAAALFGCTAFFLARARFYRMPIVNRHVVIRGMR